MYVPRGRRSQTTPPIAATPNSESVTKVEVLNKENAIVIASPNSTVSPDNQCSETAEVSLKELVIDKKVANNHNKPTTEQHSHSQTVQADHEEKPPPQSISFSIAAMTDTNTKNECSKIESSLNSSDKDYNEEKELQRASKVRDFILDFIQRRNSQFNLKKITFDFF